MKAILVTGLPAKLVDEGVGAKLRARGVIVDRIVNPKKASVMTAAAGSVDYVLLMPEFANGLGASAAKDLAKEAGAKFMLLRAGIIEESYVSVWDAFERAWKLIDVLQHGTLISLTRKGEGHPFAILFARAGSS